MRRCLASLVLLGVVACGGTTRHGDGQGGQASGGSGPMPPAACAAMAARSSGDDCAGIAGYRYNGQLCEAVVCSCVGSDCGRLFGTMEDCDRAHRDCYAEQGLTRACERHSHCALSPRTCCFPCGTPVADAYIALRFDATSPQSAGLCLGDPDAGCPECEQGKNPSVHAACIDGECSVVDVTASAACQMHEDCQLVTKDCCDCGGDFSQWGVMSVNDSYVRPERCDGVGCDGCVPEPPTEFGPRCDSERGVCSIIVSLH